MRSPVIVDTARCRSVAALLQHTPIPPASEEGVGHTIPEKFVPNFYLAIVAICHQTQALRGEIDGREHRGWDYLRERWMKAAAENLRMLDPLFLQYVRAKDLTAILGPTLEDPEGRASLLNDIGEKLRNAGVFYAARYYELTGGWLSGPGIRPGLLGLLSEFRAFGADPVRKKLFYFLILMNRYCGWEYADPEHLGPPVDYHEVRGHLRLGTVRVEDELLEQKLRDRTSLTEQEDVALRQAVFDAIMTISQESGILPQDLHYSFWNLFRNCCRRDDVHCTACNAHPSLPERYEAIVPGHCLFADVCEHAGQPLAAQYLEPIVKTEYY